MKYLARVSYDGKNYHGWAKQPNKNTIQSTIESSLLDLFNQKTIIKGSGRTDSGVHALNQMFSFDLENINITNENLMIALNKKLPNDIRILNIKNVEDNFDAQFDAVKKSYLYVINTSEKYDLFKKDYIFQYNKNINIKLIKKASKLLIGKHDFLSFSTSELDNTTREIFSIKIIKRRTNIEIEICGNGFLRNMIRMIVGSFILLNENKINLEEFQELIQNPKKGSSNLKAPSCGLYLKEVLY